MYIDDYATCAETNASLWIFHEDHDPDTITGLLGIHPTEAWKRGGSRNPRARWPVPAKSGDWVLSTDGVLQSRDVRRHIDWLLDQVEPRREALQRLQAQGCRMSIRCFWLSASGQGGPTLSPWNMARLADLELELSFDFYLAEEDGAKDECARRPVTH